MDEHTASVRGREWLRLGIGLVGPVNLGKGEVWGAELAFPDRLTIRGEVRFAQECDVTAKIVGFIDQPGATLVGLVFVHLEMLERSVLGRIEGIARAREKPAP